MPLEIATACLAFMSNNARIKETYQQKSSLVVIHCNSAKRTPLGARGRHAT